MEQLLSTDDFDRNGIPTSDRLLKYVSKFWNEKQWEQYLSQYEGPQPEEEIYVGTSSELEKFVAGKSETGFVSASTVDASIEFQLTKGK
jgi:hypothetical protein